MTDDDRRADHRRRMDETYDRYDAWSRYCEYLLIAAVCSVIASLLWIAAFGLGTGFFAGIGLLCLLGAAAAERKSKKILAEYDLMVETYREDLDREMAEALVRTKITTGNLAAEELELTGCLLYHIPKYDPDTWRDPPPQTEAEKRDYLEKHGGRKLA